MRQMTAGEFEALSGGGVGAGPVVANDYFVVLGYQVFDGYMQVRNFFQCGAYVLHGTLRAWRETWRNVGAVIDEGRSEI
jgi:hypothetical protein